MDKATKETELYGGKTKSLLKQILRYLIWKEIM